MLCPARTGESAGHQHVETARKDPRFDQESNTTSALARTSALASLSLLATLVLTVIFFIDSISEPVHGWRLSNSLFHPAAAAKTLDVVVAHYSEEAAMVSNLTTYLRQVGHDKGLRARVLVYTKGTPPTDSAERDKFKADTGADELQYLPNVGREGETYLRHILERYNGGPKGMADWTLFTQAGMFGFANADDKDPYLHQALQDDFQTDTSFLSLAIPSFHHTSLCGQISSEQVWPRLGEISNLIHGVTLCREKRLVSWTGQFIVSRPAVLSQPLTTYRALYEPFHEPADSAVHLPHGEDYCQELLDRNGGLVDVSNPCWGHSIERSWPMLFRCAQPELLDGCRAGKWCGCRL